jgi:hypothetical protein
MASSKPKHVAIFSYCLYSKVVLGYNYTSINLLKPIGYVMNQQFNIQQL